MKNSKATFSFICLALCVLLLPACAKVNVAAIKDTKKIALISVLAPERVNVAATVEKGPLGILAAVTQDDSTKVQPSIIEMKDAILKHSKSIFKVPVVAEKTVLRSKKYKAINDKNLRGRISPKGYKQIYPGEKEKILQAIEGLDGVGGALIVIADVKISKVKKGIIGGKKYATLQTILTFHLYDKNGEVILMQGSGGEAKDDVVSYAGFWRGNEMQRAIAQSVAASLENVRNMIDRKFQQAEQKKAVASK
ncbi:MAG: hypothetical protein RQ724_11035 [Desulfuromonadales bacterium]|nr:hypothetical protein [Desulfuromonadales bacterium]